MKYASSEFNTQSLFFYTCIADTLKLKVIKISLALQMIDLVLVLLCIIGDI